MADHESPRESEDWYRRVVEGAGDIAIFSLDPELRVRTWNSGAERLFGYPAEEIIGTDGLLIFTAEDQARGAAKQEVEIAANEGRAEDERWHVRRDRTRFWATGKLMALRDETGQVDGYVKVVEDRTAAKRVEESLRRSEDQFARVFLGNPAAIAVESRSDGRFLFANEQFFRLTGRWRSEVMGRSGEDLGLWARPGQRGEAPAGAERVGPLMVDIRTRDGTVVSCLAVARAAELAGEPGMVWTYIEQGASGGGD